MFSKWINFWKNKFTDFILIEKWHLKRYKIKAKMHALFTDLTTLLLFRKRTHTHIKPNSLIKFLAHFENYMQIVQR